MGFVRLALVTLFLFSSVLPVIGQKGTAHGGYFPTNYGGSTFTGSLSSVTDTTLALTYVHGSKSETFEGEVSSPCFLPISKTETRQMPLTELPRDVEITAYYQTKTTKVDGKKTTVNNVIGISFEKINGKEGPEGKQWIFMCVPKGTPLSFRYFQ